MDCDDCLDLPSLTSIQCLQPCSYIHFRMYDILFESRIQLTSFSLDIPNLTYDNIDYGGTAFHYAHNIKSISILFLCIFTLQMLPA